MKKERKIRREALRASVILRIKLACSISDLALRKGAYESFFEFRV
ncbi:hypothetical protein LEP1GSC188_0368 [Leptospira weilii serovar Topaz str. LT2116]|uniref:Uncharacterized protein n=1 Tax=Leptospira weilii serovar Topaz str. LT2116 TaxID=1088540 RepID=M3H661_9LEPT|nr:hypothetical protein LEP1GSC188_0368 [Leptospira weilii serovar Topaz str. LT2116]